MVVPTISLSRMVERVGMATFDEFTNGLVEYTAKLVEIWMVNFASHNGEEHFVHNGSK